MSDESPLTRRELLKTAAAATGAAAVAHTGLGSIMSTSGTTLPTRKLGRTGVAVPMLCLGTGRIGHHHDFEFAKTVPVIQHAIESGLTYIDTAESYKSEEHVGKAIAGRRQDLFVASKTLQRGQSGALRDLEQSLKLLGTDKLDLWQVHSIGHHGETGEQAIERLRAADSVMAAMRRAKEEGTVRFIGFTGHTKPEYMLDLLAADDLEFDTMLFALGPAVVARNAGWEEQVLPRGRQRKLGLIAMKVFGGGQSLADDKDVRGPAPLLKYAWDRGLTTADVGLYTKDQVDQAVAALKAYRPSTAEPDNAAAARLRAPYAHTPLPYERPDYVDAAIT